VAFTIELDNEAEHRLAHWTNEDDDAARVHTPWLVSYPLWANVLRHVGPDGTTVAQLRAQARTERLLLGGLNRWGYLRLVPPAGADLKNPPAGETVVHLTRHGRAGGEVWRAMPAVIEARWRSTHGDAAIDALRGALSAVFGALDLDPPDYLPVVYPAKNGVAEAPVARTGARDDAPDLSVLLSGLLFAFTVDFEAASRICLPISANTLRVLDHDGVRNRDLPRLTGVSKEANAMCAGWLQRHGCAETAPDPNASRGQVLRLTGKGQAAQDKYWRILAATEASWRSTYGAAAIDATRDALEPLVGDGTIAASPLAPGLAPRPDNWRAGVRAAEMLPHYPMVLHRGAYPDGS
jgi:hypothetical protein